jgi:hypothetical protein
MLGNIGSCGGTKCLEAPPLSCYRCQYFWPWRIADHEGLFATVMEFRELVAKGLLATPYTLDLIDQALAGIKSAIETKREMSGASN